MGCRGFVVRVPDQSRQASRDTVVGFVVAVVFENAGLGVAKHVEVGSDAGDQFPDSRINITVKLRTRPRECPLVPDADIEPVVPALLYPCKEHLHHPNHKPAEDLKWHLHGNEKITIVDTIALKLISFSS